MIVVADTTPLNYLIQLGYPEVLRELYGRVLVPPAVLTEMQHLDAPPEVQAWAAAPPSWLEQTLVTELDTTLAERLGIGERQAISLALELHADVLLIDELADAEKQNSGTSSWPAPLTVLLQASLRGYCAFPEAVKQLREYGFWVSASVEAELMARYESAKKKSP